MPKYRRARTAVARGVSSCIAAWASAVLAHGMLVFASSCADGDDNRTTCQTHDDCWEAPELQELGRCFPKEAVCNAGYCDGRCAASCTVVRQDVNPCAEPALICNQRSAVDPEDDEVAYCQSTEIQCSSSADCPIYRPTSEGAWECRNGVCRFPGFDYP